MEIDPNDIIQISGKTGLNCEIGYNPCNLAAGSSSGPCLNNGLCTVDMSIFPYFSCTCTPGFSGARCQINSNTKMSTISCTDSDLFLCKIYSSQKYCTGPYYLKGIQVANYCPKSCNTCSSSSTSKPSNNNQCLDQGTQCSFWASQNYCQNYPIFNICRFSCNLC